MPTKEEKKSKFVHVPMYQVSYDYQHKGKVSSNTSRHKVRWIFGYASYDALKKKYIGDDCRDEEHELEFHLTSSLEKKKLRILHNGRILIEDIRVVTTTEYDDEENSNDENIIFEHDFTIKGKNHEAKLVILKDEEDSTSSSFIINPQLSFGGLPFEDLPQTNEIQRNILSLYVAVPRSSSSKKKHHHHNDYHHMLEEEDEINSKKEEEERRIKEKKRKDNKKKSKNDRASTGKMMYTNMTLNKEPKLHKLLDPNSSFALEDTMKREAAKATDETNLKNRAKSETNQRLGFMGGSGHGSTAAVDDDDEESDEVIEDVGTDENLSSSHHEPYYDENADVEQMIEQSLFLAEDQIDHSQEQQEHWPDGRPKVMRSSSFASISSAGSSCSTVMDGTDSDEDDNDGSVYLDRSTRSMFDSSSSSDESGAGKKSRTGSQADGASSAANDDDNDDSNDNASISTAGSSVVGKMAELNVDDMLNHLINDSDDDDSDSDSDDDDEGAGKKKKTKGIPSSIKI